MNIRKATEKDIPQLVKIDHDAYGEYGADNNYFNRKLNSYNASILVVEEKDKLTGFIVFEVMEKDEIPEDFRNLTIKKSIKDKWIHVIAFTTQTNYLDIDSDTKLLLEAEKLALEQGINTFCAPLSVDHPFSENKVFEFWERNNYKKVGTIEWIASPTENIPCYFYLKQLDL